MTPERIAEIEELAATKAPMVYVRAGSIRELCRLARLGLQIQELYNATGELEITLASLDGDSK